MASGTTRYRRAHTAGTTGAKLPDGLASMADSDPKIDAAHDAGRNGVSFDDFASEHLTTSKREGAPAPSRRSSRSAPGSPGAPSLRRPLGANVPIGVGAGTGLAGIFLGAIAYALILSVVDYGSKGPGMWFKAKFENTASAASSRGAAAGAGGGAVAGGSGGNATNAAIANLPPAQQVLASQMAAAAAAGG